MENKEQCNDENFKEELAHLKEEIQHEKSEIEFEEKQIQHEKKEIEYLEEKAEELEHSRCDFTIIVNAEEKDYHEREISFKKVIELAFGSMIENGTKAYTVTYKKGPKENPEGSMISGQVVKVQDKMRFNATQTNKS
ncbi:Multiubiquitin [Mucilaginibacter pineti]|uniref:Multiubiquitin n=1 Tax=Mucilaginibacter pineti TaxID=1391627 RepID=A0A1G7L4Q7_9SPHI|nr:multiubiquitin domain-containing protein [Mucilaginibacter pineti]SDF44336.1 Multiubiquitin [Mucilaginibacter pineti]